jgi:protein-S-isoprenylcysteine O-methyltransferase Ste14
MVGVIVILPLYFKSLEHTNLDNKYGKEKGKKIGAIYGMISGWSFFIFWFGIWISPQPEFTIPFLQQLILIPIVSFSIPLLNLCIFLFFTIIAIWLGIAGVKGTTLETSETHRAKKIVNDGVYSIVRHPQYLGGLLGHIGITFLLSSLYSLLCFPLMVTIVYFISKKEEKELIKEFGDAYENYQKKVPMLIPRFKRNK